MADEVSNNLNDGLFASLVDNDKNAVAFSDTDEALVKDWLPTLIPQVDSVMLGGFPMSGRVTEIFGEPSVGKSTLTHSALAIAQRTGNVVPVIYDIEGTINRERLVELGVDPSRVMTLVPERKRDGTVNQITVEQVIAHMIKTLADVHNSVEAEIKAKKRNPEDKVLVLFIWDTVAMTQANMQASAEVGAQTVGQQSRALSEGIRKLNPNLLANNGALIALNQARADIGGNNPFIKETKTVGGNAWQHEMSLRLLMRAGSKEKASGSDKDNVIGKTVRLSFKKSKVGSNDGAVAEGILLKDTGFDLEYNVLQEAKDKKLVTSGAWVKYVDDNGEIFNKRNADWIGFLKSPEGRPVFTELWQKLIKIDFPECYPPLFNTTLVLSEDKFPFVAGLREYYINIQEQLPIENQNTNYRVWKKERSHE